MRAPARLADHARANESVARGNAFLADLHKQTLAKREASRGKLPAYGRAFMQMRQRGLIPYPPEIRVCLDSWDWDKAHHRVVVSRSHDAGGLDYRFVAGLDVVMKYSPWISFKDRRDALIRALVRCNPTRLYVLAVDAPNQCFFVISQAVGLERTEYAA